MQPTFIFISLNTLGPRGNLKVVSIFLDMCNDLNVFYMLTSSGNDCCETWLVIYMFEKAKSFGHFFPLFCLSMILLLLLLYKRKWISYHDVFVSLRSLMRNIFNNVLKCINKVSLHCMPSDSFKGTYQICKEWFPSVKLISLVLPIYVY